MSAGSTAALRATPAGAILARVASGPGARWSLALSNSRGGLIVDMFDAVPRTNRPASSSNGRTLGSKSGRRSTHKKARSEFIIAPILMEFRRIMAAGFDSFSGVKFNVDASRGLDGYCIFLLTRSRLQSALTTPVVTIVEAKNATRGARWPMHRVDSGRAGFNSRSLFWFRIGALLHDIGKIIVPTDVLNKPGKLSAEEWAIMKRHPEAGLELVAEIDFPGDITSIIRNHHERWDGAGYPDGLAGEQIPLAARILCVADVYDALTTTRSYRTGLTHARAAEIMRSSTGQFDPHLLEMFLDWAGTADIPGRPTPQRMAIFASAVES